MDFVALRKLAAGIVVLLLASGVIKSKTVEKHRWLRIGLYVVGVLLVVLSLFYQFNVIPESSTDVLLR